MKTLLALPFAAFVVLVAACSTKATPTASEDDAESAPGCDLAPEKQGSADACKKGTGCGDLMVCQSFCAGCEQRCQVPCQTSDDCAEVGAGSCEKSAKASNKCSGPPTKCPGAAPTPSATTTATGTATGSAGAGD